MPQKNSQLRLTNKTNRPQDSSKIKLKPPQTLQDCILALHNPLRRQLGFKQLEKLLNSQPSDVIFVWKSLLKSLIHPLQQLCIQGLKRLFVLRPKEWIRDVGQMYFSKDMGTNEKVMFIETLQLAIKQLAENPHKFVSMNEDNQQSREFYFKRVSSKYYNQRLVTLQISKDESRTRRWGHTRIAYEKTRTSNTSVQSLAANNHPKTNSILIVSNQPYISRLYQIVSQLFFKIILRMTQKIDKDVKNQPLYAHHFLNLLSTIAENIKNHLDKYVILEDITLVCLNVLVQVQKLQSGEKSSRLGSIFVPKPLWDKKAESQIILSSIQTLNKVALALDKFVPQLIMINLNHCVTKLKKIDMYSIRPLIEMVEANIYKNTCNLAMGHTMIQ